MVLSTEHPPAVAEDRPGPAGRPLRTVLIVLLSLAALVLAGGVGYVAGHRNGSATPGAGSVDAGFAWDMSAHHRQAVTMAGYVRDHSTDGVVRTLAYDIETSQFNQVGQMQGWLDAWGLPPENPGTPMSWIQGEHGMGSMAGMSMSGGLMPGMATQAEVDKLQRMTGKAMDVYFLQLMLRHHQGGLPMAQYGAAHASESYVRNAAQKMATGQSAEIVLMEQLLRERGASPLPPPA
ncbi:MAG: hypothetical protein QOE23_801 [Pseudonocardiales bacterium]|jgi:uncharacterized protein (DUF305 family)|nr:hypothetical protein [Pseudonocardiales bacterium]